MVGVGTTWDGAGNATVAGGGATWDGAGNVTVVRAGATWVCAGNVTVAGGAVGLGAGAALSSFSFVFFL